MMKIYIAMIGTLFVSCAGSRPKPDDMSAAAHRREAVLEKQKASYELSKYDPLSRKVVIDPAAARTGFEEEDTINPTVPHLKRAERIAAHAAEHESAAAALEQFEGEECTGLPLQIRVACPLMRSTSVEKIESGVRVHLKSTEDVEPTLALMRCHLAYARAQAFEGLPSCPLYMKGVEINASANGRAIEIVSRDRKIAKRITQLALEEIEAH